MHMHIIRKIGYDSDLIERDSDLVDAAGVLASNIFWGGRVAELSSTRMVTVTNACGGFDRHTFTGTEPEMRPLLEVLFCTIMTRRPIDWLTLEKVRELLGGEPAYYTDHKGGFGMTAWSAVGSLPAFWCLHRGRTYVG